MPSLKRFQFDFSAYDAVIFEHMVFYGFFLIVMLQIISTVFGEQSPMLVSVAFILIKWQKEFIITNFREITFFLIINYI